MVKIKKVKEITDLDIEVLSSFKKADEKNLAKSLLSKYLKEYEITSVSDRGNLAQLIFLEVNQVRIQEKLNEIYDKDAKAIQQDLLELSYKNTEYILKVKNNLGLVKAKDQKLTGYDAFEHYKQRLLKWGQANQASREFKCCHCSKFNILWIDPKVWESRKHPFFQDTFLYNKPLLDNLDRTITIDRKFLASVFEVSTDYIDWVINKIKNQQKIGDTDGQEEASRKEKSTEEGIVDESTENSNALELKN